MKQRFFICLAVCFLGLSIRAGAEMTKEQYIDHFKRIAISEMDRSGIPASIKLAQGILESRYGNSSLATEANNHFGIKCHSGWTGKGYYLKDDDLDANGQLIESCFRVYSNPESSFYDHTEFLSTRGRYAFLFQYDRKDYKNWARGLKTAGYATNPEYANILIRVIQENKLHAFDKMTSDVLVFKPEDPAVEEPFPILSAPTNVLELFTMNGKRNEVFVVNDAQAVTAWPDDTPLSVAQNNNVALSRLLNYNDMLSGDEMVTGQYVFLQPKRKKFRGTVQYHTLRQGESMYLISQKYGVKLDRLYKRNNMDPSEGREPVPGSRIYLKGKTDSAPKLQPRGYEPTIITTPVATTTSEEPAAWSPATTDTDYDDEDEVDNSLPANPDEVIVPEPVVRPILTRPESEQPVTPSGSDPGVEELDIIFQPGKAPGTSQPIAVDDVPLPPAAPSIHVVQPGDTLYGISRKYQLTVDQLRQKNGLQTDLIKIGQELIVE